MRDPVGPVLAAARARPKILFVINSMAGGGAERVMAMLLARSEPMRSRYDMRLALLDTEPDAYEIPGWLPTERLDARGSLLRSARRLRALTRRYRPELTLSFLTRSNLATAYANLFGRRRWIISERVHPTAHLGSGKRAFVAKALMRAGYPRADAVIAVSSGVANDLSEHYGVLRSRIRVLDNPVDHQAIDERRGESFPDFAGDSELLVVSAGRLTPNKNFEMLVRAYAVSRLPGDLVIAGEGPERARLERTVASLGLAGRVHLPGFVANPFALFGKADLFVLSSNAEGFPNTLVEAMACGLPVVATNCQSGPSEILAGVPRGAIRQPMIAPFGMLVPPNDTVALASALRQMADPELRRRLAAAASKRSLDYGIEQATTRYWGAITATLSAAEAPDPAREQPRERRTLSPN